jgi:predicted DsbA family dithiol-disulfide isomerase
MENYKGRKVKVVIYSDYICPFCYIGFHRVEKLKEKFNLEIEWQPFEIHPETPKEGIKLEQLPFPPGYLEMIMINVKKLADEDGINLKLSEKLPNSRLALSLSEFAKKKMKFDEFHKLVFENYWKEGKDIGDLNLLLELAESIGLKKNEILDYIKSNEPYERMRKILIELRKYGINGVPTFLIGNRFIFGAQPHEVFEKAITDVLEEDNTISNITDQ